MLVLLMLDKFGINQSINHRKHTGDRKVKLEDCKYGQFVIAGDQVGMIVGLSNNRPLSDIINRRNIDNAVIKVQWSSV